MAILFWWFKKRAVLYGATFLYQWFNTLPLATELPFTKGELRNFRRRPPELWWGATKASLSRKFFRRSFLLLCSSWQISCCRRNPSPIDEIVLQGFLDRKSACFSVFPSSGRFFFLSLLPSTFIGIQDTDCRKSRRSICFNPGPRSQHFHSIRKIWMKIMNRSLATGCCGRYKKVVPPRGWNYGFHRTWRVFLYLYVSGCYSIFSLSGEIFYMYAPSG